MIRTGRSRLRARLHERLRALLLVLGAGAAFPALALDYQLHGFAAQGFSLSEGNNYFGDSTHGSTNFYELGVNGTLSLTPELLVSAQGLLRRAGQTDTDGLRLDFAQLDYRFISTSGASAGLRVGRVKNPYGFFNETRDVVFTRPGITLPNSIYFESTGLRSILFSRYGTQLYGDLALGDHTLSLTGNYNLNFKLTEAEKRRLTGGQFILPNEVEINNFYLARLQDDWNAGTVKLAATYLHAALDTRPQPASPIDANLAASIILLSARYNGRRYSVFGEYTIEYVRTRGNLAPANSSASDGFYLQGEYQLLPTWTAFARYDAAFSNRHDRDGRAFEAQTGGDRYGQFAHDEMVGLNWRPDAHWGVWAEFHLFQGRSNVPALDNLGRPPDNHANLLLLMAAYRF